MQRERDSRIAIDGLILTEEEDAFEGDIQLLLFANRPDEAFHICTKYAPNCLRSSSNYFPISTSHKIGSSSSGSFSENRREYSYSFDSNRRQHGEAEIVLNAISHSGGGGIRTDSSRYDTTTPIAHRQSFVQSNFRTNINQNQRQSLDRQSIRNTTQSANRTLLAMERTKEETIKSNDPFDELILVNGEDYYDTLDLNGQFGGYNQSAPSSGKFVKI